MLERAIYGLKKSGHKWDNLCADTLIADCFKHYKANSCIFGKIADGVVVLIIVSVWMTC